MQLNKHLLNTLHTQLLLELMKLKTNNKGQHQNGVKLVSGLHALAILYYSS